MHTCVCVCVCVCVCNDMAYTGWKLVWLQTIIQGHICVTFPQLAQLCTQTPTLVPCWFRMTSDQSELPTSVHFKQVHIYLFIHSVCVCVCVCSAARICACVRACMHACMHVCVCVHACVCECESVLLICVCMCQAILSLWILCSYNREANEVQANRNKIKDWPIKMAISPALFSLGKRLCLLEHLHQYACVRVADLPHD